jgi:exodeoxyribonuclease VII small subunit
MAQQKFEDAMKRLEEVVESLESGELSLKESLQIFEEGMKLVSFCSKKLEEAEQKITMLIKESDGKYTHQPFDMKEGDEPG